MDIRQTLNQGNTKPIAVMISAYIGDDAEKFRELMEIFLGNDPRLSQRAAWVVSHCADRHPALIRPWIKPMIKNLKNNDNVAVKRNTVRVFQWVDIPGSEMGKLADICFDYLGSASEPIAVKVFSMSVLFNMCKKIPELKNELLPMIEDQMPYGSVGFRSRGRKIIAELKKI